MRRIAIIALLAGSFIATPAVAQSPLVQQQIRELQAQVEALQQELTLLKTFFIVRADGSVVVNTPANLDFSASGLHRMSVVGESVTSIGGNHTATVGGSTSSSVRGAARASFRQTLTEEVGQQYVLQVGTDRADRAGGNHQVEAGRNLVLQAGDSILLRSGAASIELKKSGDVAISGRNISIDGTGTVSVKASGEVTLRGSKILQN